jgi:hypothetical protein
MVVYWWKFRAHWSTTSIPCKPATPPSWSSQSLQNCWKHQYHDNDWHCAVREGDTSLGWSSNRRRELREMRLCNPQIEFQINGLGQGRKPGKWGEKGSPPCLVPLRAAAKSATSTSCATRLERSTEESSREGAAPARRSFKKGSKKERE